MAFWTNRVVFVHIPRTGGDWLTAWAARHLHASVARHWLKHEPREALVGRVPELAGLEAFTVVRDEDARFASFLAHCRGFDLEAAVRTWTPEWGETVRAARDGPPDRFLAERFAPAVYWTWDPAVRAFPFEPDLTACRAWLWAAHGGSNPPPD